MTDRDDDAPRDDPETDRRWREQRRRMAEEIRDAEAESSYRMGER